MRLPLRERNGNALTVQDRHRSFWLVQGAASVLWMVILVRLVLG
jgi:hypothetical protein